MKPLSKIALLCFRLTALFDAAIRVIGRDAKGLAAAAASDDAHLFTQQ
jgi:hypothetical protein